MWFFLCCVLKIKKERVSQAMQELLKAELRVQSFGCGRKGLRGAAEDGFTLGLDGEPVVTASSTAVGFQWCQTGSGCVWRAPSPCAHPTLCPAGRGQALG